MKIIQHQELGSTAAAITFSSIPSTFTDLYLLLSVRSTNNDDNLYFKFNNTTANTSSKNLLGYGSGTISQTYTGFLHGGGMKANTANTFNNISIYMPNYATANAKVASVDSVSEANQTDSYQFIVTNLWNDSTAINRIDVYPQGGSLTQYSSATLYGITKGSDGIVTVS